MKKRLIGIGMTSLILVSLVQPACATVYSDELTRSSASRASTFSVTVPTSLPIDVSADGTVSTATDAKIINNSSGSVQISNVDVQPLNGWELVDYNSDFLDERVGTKKLGLQLMGDTTNQDGVLDFTADNWPKVGSLTEESLPYDAVLSAQDTAINDEVATVIFTVEWDSSLPNPDMYVDFEIDRENKYDILGYTDEEKNLVIPSTFTGGDGVNYRVTSIGFGAFSGCEIESVTIPDSVITIDDYAFEQCTSLKSVTIPDSVATIGIYAFSSCGSLTSVIIPDSVTSIGVGAFYDCTNLKSVILPAGITTIKNETFNRCKSLASIDIPDNVISIGEEAFVNCTSLGQVTIPDSVTLIEKGAFMGCTKLSSVDIPNSVTTIKEYAFYKCESLKSVDIKEGIESIGYNTFYGCTSLESISIPNSITTIEGSTFYGCISLKSVIIPDSVAKIGINAFAECYGLEITVPDSVVTIGRGAFSNVPLVIYGGTATGSPWGATSFKIPDKEYRNFAITYDNKEMIGCTNSTSTLVIPSTIMDNDGIEYRVTSIGNEAFSFHGYLESVVIPDSVTSIANNAFYCCEALKSVVIPDSITSIETNVFFGCKSLKSVNIPSSVTTIYGDAFGSCTSLESVTIPDSVTYIGANAFYNVPHIEYHGNASGAPWGALSMN